jgi:C4-dicarboxylate transporter/malic acid transport protein
MKGHPGWYGAVMGTGALSLALSVQAVTWEAEWLRWAAQAFLVLASVLGVVLLPRYAARLKTRADIAHELSDPAHGAMLSTLPAGLLILATAWGRVGWEPIGLWVDLVLLVVGTVIALVLGAAWAAAMLREPQGLEGVNGGWLIPPVMNLIVPLALAPLIPHAGAAALSLVLLGFAFYGIGVILFLAMLTLLIARLALRDPMPAPMAPSLWIPLAPAGVVGLALIQLLRAATEAGLPGFPVTPGLVVAAMGLGFGLWWAVFAWMELRRVRAAGGPPRHPGWWGFVFPVAAMVLSLATTALLADVVVLQVLGALATVGLLGVWGLVALRTVGMLRA